MTRLMLRPDPFLDLDLEFPREIERLLSRPFTRGLGLFTDGWFPMVDIVETKDEVVVKAEIPGMTKEDITVALQDNVLTLRGEKKQEEEEKGKTFHRVERCHGSFSRSFTLPVAVQAGRVKATYRDGILQIMLPKAEEVKSKEIPISVD